MTSISEQAAAMADLQHRDHVFQVGTLVNRRIQCAWSAFRILLAGGLWAYMNSNYSRFMLLLLQE